MCTSWLIISYMSSICYIWVIKWVSHSMQLATLSLPAQQKGETLEPQSSPGFSMPTAWYSDQAFEGIETSLYAKVLWHRTQDRYCHSGLNIAVSHRSKTGMSSAPYQKQIPSPALLAAAKSQVAQKTKPSLSTKALKVLVIMQEKPISAPTPHLAPTSDLSSSASTSGVVLQVHADVHRGKGSRSFHKRGLVILFLLCIMIQALGILMISWTWGPTEMLRPRGLMQSLDV